MSLGSLPSASRKPRAHTASEIAKDPARFAVWSAHQNLVEGAYHGDMPAGIRAEADVVFDVFKQLPQDWVTPESEIYHHLSMTMSAEFLKFLRRAAATKPQLFSSQVEHKDCLAILGELQAVFSSWIRLKEMRESSCKWSEADWASQVYNPLRIPAGKKSNNRSQCFLSLPQPLDCYQPSASATKNLSARTVRPDGSLFIPGHRIKHLWESENAPFNVLCQSPKANSSGSHGGASSFKWQSTLSARLADTSKIEVASSFWEDKKPIHHELGAAYRQNRMATTAALRQLYALNVHAPVFGLVWSEGTVRAHVDWWNDDEHFRIVSAAYPGAKKKGARRASLPFYEWNLGRPSHIIQVYLLMRNLDRWTVHGFQKLVEQGITELAAAVADGSRSVAPWRRRGGNVGGKLDDADVGYSISTSPAKRPAKSRARTTKCKA
ncbi:hypothetical protein K466DRAFT_602670 [Polyporus arcularius HHB13444]|uniref:Uncharacterized protein n=1 Tax=Polyporus arcularius HHB13444 TaxID=1314778 RepID=A0A5C3P1Z0_9APHY|nr:hypothetical protein K466DRAFT_602670 [Polyporus arcularius HHB13444]